MKKSIWIWEIFGFAVTVLGGTVLHFLYDWLDGAVWIAPFSGVNESTWEHMKLMLWPMFIYGILQSFFFKEYEGFWCIKLRSTLAAILLIPLLFYTYNGVIGKSPDAVNILIFFISALLAYIYEALMLKRGVKCRSNAGALLTLCAICILFIIFTFKTPMINIFKDPLTQTYGI